MIWGGDNNINNTPNSIHGNDYLDGGEGNDQIVGGGGSDEIYGGTGNDDIWGDDSEANLDKQYHGNDYIDVGAGDDIVYGGSGTDTLIGGAGKDSLFGGNDLLSDSAEINCLVDRYKPIISARFAIPKSKVGYVCDDIRKTTSLTKTNDSYWQIAT